MFSVHTDAQLENASPPDLVFIPALFGDMQTAIDINKNILPWIDGVRRSINEESYCIRFTPRKQKSIWSAVNLKKMKELIANGKMQEAGLSIFNLRDGRKQNIYSFERVASPFPTELENLFQANVVAWEFFNKQPAGYKKLMIHRVLAAKQEITKLSRLEKLIEESEKGKRIR